jgi:3-hydroxyacyl-CoA dehydrogenase
MIEQYSRQALFMLDEGASPLEIDAAIEAFGFAMGPFRMSDLAGNDISWHIRKRRYVEQPTCSIRASPTRLRARSLRMKTNAGWYDYQPGDDGAAVSRGRRTDCETSRGDQGAAARSTTRRSCSAACSRSSTKARASWKNASRSAPRISISFI